MSTVIDGTTLEEAAAVALAVKQMDNAFTMRILTGSEDPQILMSQKERLSENSPVAQKIDAFLAARRELHALVREEVKKAEENRSLSRYPFSPRKRESPCQENSN